MSSHQRETHERAQELSAIEARQKLRLRGHVILAGGDQLGVGFSRAVKKLFQYSLKKEQRKDQNKNGGAGSRIA